MTKEIFEAHKMAVALAAVLAMLLAAAIWLSLIDIAGAQQTTFYGPNGQIVGRSVKSNDTTLFYNADGSRAGSATRFGNSTTFYGANGSIVGRSFK
jgi:hypothetical protein